ncbi:MAG TPA: hypothetical protein VLC95_15425 [Anaerolineae bacterium]|nr:hypothetical protein [Anaerolineae bacterium]
MDGLIKRLSGPVKVGLIVGALGAVLTVAGLVSGNLAPLTVRTLLLGILLGGGAWGVVSWAIASAAVDAIGFDPAEANVRADSVDVDE